MEGKIEKMGIVLGGKECGMAVVRVENGGESLSIASCNKSYCDRIGMQSEMVIGKDPREFKEYDRDFNEQMVLDKIIEGETVCVECSWKRKDGREASELICIIPFDSEGIRYCMVMSQYLLLAHVAP